MKICCSSSDDLAPFLSITPHYFPLHPLPLRSVSPQDVRWRRDICSRGGGVVSVVVGIALTRGSNNAKRPVVSRSAAASRSGSPISYGEPRTRITSAVPIHSKRKSTERALTTCGSTAQEHPDYVRRNAAYVQKWRQKLRQASVSHTSSDPRLTVESEKTSNQASL